MSSRQIIKRETDFAGKTLSLESGRLAFQANQAVLARYGDTVVLATVVANDASEDLDYFPLRVDYEEKLYSGGLIKGSRFIKREGRPSDEATVTARLLDHSIRPLFPADFYDDVQVMTTVLSVEPEADVQFVAMVAASAALHASDIPWLGPLAAVRVVQEEKDGEFKLNPPLYKKNGNAEVEPISYQLNIIPSFREGRLIGVEGEGNQVPDEQFLGALEFASEQSKAISSFIDEFASEVGKEKYVYTPKILDQEMITKIHELVGADIKELVTVPRDKLDWVDAYQDILEKVLTEFEGKYSKSNMKRGVNYVEKTMVRVSVLEDGKRPDGRKFDEVRDLAMETGLLPRTHGSALFTRGLTQAMTITTLGSLAMGQIIQNMLLEQVKRYIHHYYGRPFSLGETGALRSPGRREIGHGALAEKALHAVLPPKEEFPYTMRVVSEVLSQNGSSSMAATCGSTLSLMDAGVPISAPVGGIAVGLVVDENTEEYQVLTDIQGTEDFNGFLDFKMPGTRAGMTAIQMDTKFKKGLTMEMVKDVIEASRTARMTILDAMEKCMATPREQVSEYAPKVLVVKIDPKRIGELIGPGGKVIKKIIEDTGAEVDVDNDGVVSISAVEEERAQTAAETVRNLMRQVEIDEVFDGVVTKVTDFGAFVEILPGKEGLVHVSELAYDYVEKVEDVINEGESIKVKVIGVDRQGKISLSKKALEERPANQPARPGGGRQGGGRSSGGNTGYQRGSFRSGGRHLNRFSRDSSERKPRRRGYKSQYSRV